MPRGPCHYEPEAGELTTSATMGWSRVQGGRRGGIIALISSSQKPHVANAGGTVAPACTRIGLEIQKEGVNFYPI